MSGLVPVISEKFELAKLLTAPFFGQEQTTQAPRRIELRRAASDGSFLKKSNWAW